MQTTWLYQHPTLLIVALLFLAIVLMNEAAYHVGKFVQAKTDTEVKALTGSIQGSILGLLALMLGFTFSMSMQRFDQRSMALIDEANAIGTVQLRTELLPVAHQAEMVNWLNRYIDQRIEVSQIDLTNTSVRQQYQQAISLSQQKLWALTVEAVEVDPRPATTGAFMQALNGMIDAQGKRNALLQMQVPDIVLLLLFVIFIASSSMLGYSSGLSGHRVLTPMTLISLLITLIVFLILDLDRPKRGLIQVNQAPLVSLQATP